MEPDRIFNSFQKLSGVIYCYNLAANKYGLQARAVRSQMLRWNGARIWVVASLKKRETTGGNTFPPSGVPEWALGVLPVLQRSLPPGPRGRTGLKVRLHSSVLLRCPPQLLCVSCQLAEGLPLPSSTLLNKVQAAKREHQKELAILFFFFLSL